MSRIIHSPRPAAAPALEALPGDPDEVVLALDAASNRTRVAACVSAGQAVARGALLARGDQLSIHAPMPGVVASLTPDQVIIRRSAAAAGPEIPAAPMPPPDNLPAFAAGIGLVGMGGSMFPASIKLAAARAVHTLIINAVECEPGITIDECLLAHEWEFIRAAIDHLVARLGLKRIVLAVKRGGAAPAPAPVAGLQIEICRMPAHYPAGAEKLILRRVAGRRLPTGVLPMAWGYLVHSTATLWALGRALAQGQPVILRPLTLRVGRDVHRNVLAPVGLRVRELLRLLGCEAAAAGHPILASGSMMGRLVDDAFCIQKGTNAVFVRDLPPRTAAPEIPCINCGACHDACPLGLHPIGVVARLRAGACPSVAQPQLAECFLCGACAAVCPANIPLAEELRKGKAWLKK